MNTTPSEADKDGRLLKVAVPLPAGSPTAEETLWAVSLGDQLYRLDNTPWFARDLALGDIIRASDGSGGIRRFAELVKPSGNWTVRVFVPDAPSREEIKKEIFDFLSAEGCKYESFGSEKGLIAITIPADVGREGVLERLRGYEQEGKAHWESGNF
jgi:hypothetical protein